MTLEVTVSGSFRRHMSAIYEAVTEFIELGVDVLSPADPRVVDQLGDFVFVASDRVRSIKLVEDRHLEAIRVSDFLWLECPDGYVGQSASMELGYAVAVGTPVYSATPPSDGTLVRYVRNAGSLASVVRLFQVKRGDTRRGKTHASFLIDPVSTIERANAHLAAMHRLLLAGPGNVDDFVADRVYKHGASVVRALTGSGSERKTI